MRKYDQYIKESYIKEYKYICSTNTSKNINKDKDFPLVGNNTKWLFSHKNRDGHYYYQQGNTDRKLCVSFDKFV